MWRYLKAAFLVGVNVPALGRVPLNALGAAAVGILGLAEPSLWLLGLGAETAVLFALVNSERFRKLVDAKQLESATQDTEAKRRALMASLQPEARQRLAELDRKCRQFSEVSEQADEFIAATNREALQRLEWVYLKLLVARANTINLAGKESEEELAAQIRAMRSSLNADVSESLRQSKQATLAILEERLANVRRRHETIEEIDSDLMRIDAQVQLLLENATIQGKPPTISADIELASSLASHGVFGDSDIAVADLERAFRASEERKRTPET